MKLSYDELEEMYDMACYDANKYMKESYEMSVDIKYLQDYIKWEKLDEEFLYFKKHSHLDTREDVPFPDYIL